MEKRKQSASHEDVTFDGSSADTSGGFGAAVSRNLDAILEIGRVLGDRYVIEEMLGLGGMGAVYKAQDKELDRVIALKVIRPDIARHPEALSRFRQELLTARQVTHKNVVRIFDIGEADGIKFITMEYVRGHDLRALLAEHGKLSVPEALTILRQICSALAAAHGEGVIHRDLKPGNIMRDEQGRIVVMDFGLARPVEDTAKMTQTGAMLGTVEYMSPEQAMATKLDARSDLFTIGLIFYELITGNTPFKADSTLASLIKRTQEDAVPAIQIDPTIPKPVSDMVSRSLQRDPNKRFQSAEEMIECIDEITGKRPASALSIPSPLTRKHQWLTITVTAAIVAAVMIAGTFVWRMHKGSAVAHKPVTVLMADFSNATSDEVFDGTLEPAFALSLEGAPFITTYNRTSAKKELNEIKPGARLTEENARLLAVRDGISVVISGSVAKETNGYMLTSSAVDAITGKTISAQSISADDKSSVLKAVGSIASRIRTALGDTTPESIRLAQQETFTSGSVEAAHEYARAQELRYQGKSAEAVRGFQRATELDPNFGSAYANLAALYYNMGNRVESLKAYKLAMEHIDRMSDREKYRTRGGYYLVTANGEKAVEEFSALVEKFPADSMGLNSLAYAYSRRHDNEKALETAHRALEIYPKNVPYRTNAALYAIYSGNYDVAEKEAQSVLEINPSYEMARVTIALAQVGRGSFDQAKDTLQKLSTLSPTAASYASSGLADMVLYRSDPATAISVLQKGIEDNLSQKNNDAAAKKYAMLAEAYLMMGKKAEARAAIEHGLATDKAAIIFRAGRFYAQFGDVAKATALSEELLKEVDPLPQASGKLVQGEIELSRGRAREAIQLFEQSGRISDTWLAKFNLALAHIAAGSFTDASAELDSCIKRGGEATDIYTDEEQTFRYLPSTYYYQGLALEGLKSAGATEWFKKFLALKVSDAQDPLVANARKKLAAK
jgi:serine/threonine protein kinase/tetratricopeptide (TPR) repeat protein